MQRPPWKSIVALAAAYAFVAWASLRLFATLNASASPVWPSTGLAIAALLLWGRHLWPGVFLGACVANLLTAGNLATSLAIAGGNTLEAVVAVWLVDRFARGAAAFEQAGGVLRYGVLAGLLAPTLSATCGVLALAVAGFVPWPIVGQVWGTWWLGDAGGALVVAPLLVLAVRTRTPWTTGRPRELAALALATMAAGALVFLPVLPFDVRNLPLSYVLLPTIMWAAIRFGSREAAATTFGVAAFAVTGTLLGSGPFTATTTNLALLFLQVYIIVIALTGLVLGAVVSERRTAESAMREAREAEAKVRALVEYAPDATLLADRAGRILLANSKALALFGYSKQDLLTLAIEDLVPPELRAKHVQHRARYHEAPHARQMGTGLDLQAVRRDGSRFPVEIALGPLLGDGEGLVVASIRDVSERKAFEAKLDAARSQVAVSEKLSALGTLVSGVGHEIRTPLTYIVTNDHLIGRHVQNAAKDHPGLEGLEQAVARLLQKNRDGIARIERIVAQLRSFAKAEVKMEEANLKVVVQGAVDLFQATHRGECGVQAGLDDAPGFMVDKGQMQQVVLNLLINACEAMDKSGDIDVRLRLTPDGAEVQVADRGKGIPPEAQRRVFDPFFTTKPQGTGLGLSISRRIVEAHGGAIGFHTSGTGTVFNVFIPRRFRRPAEATP